MRVKYWIRTTKQGSECSHVLEFDDGEWEGMTGEEQNEVMREAAFDCMEWGYEAL